MKIQIEIDVDEIRQKKISWMLGIHPEADDPLDPAECKDWLSNFIEESVDGIDLPDF